MPVDYINSLKTARMQLTADDYDAGAGPGTIEILTAGYAEVLLIYTLDNPCGTVAGDPAALNFSGMPKSANGLAGGVAALGRIKDSNGVIRASGFTVTAVGGSGNFQITSTAVQAGQIVDLTSGQIIHG